MTQLLDYQQFLVDTCGSCGAEIIRAIHERTLKQSVVDAEPTKDGDILLRPRGGGKPPTYRVVGVADRFGRTDLRTSHFRTCPQAGAWRAGKKAAA